MKNRIWSKLAHVIPLVAVASAALGAQAPTRDASARLREVLPADVAERVLARIADARREELPAQALENRALKYASRGVPAADVERAIRDHADRMMAARRALAAGRAQRPRDERREPTRDERRDPTRDDRREPTRDERREPSRDDRGPRVLGEEIDAGAEAMRQGVDGRVVSELARTAPADRSLAVPLFVIGGLVERGLSADAALERVHERLRSRASDADLERLPGEVDRARLDGTRPVTRPTTRPGDTGRPANVPATGGRPTVPTRPEAGRPGRL
jgi:hypothetical protein